MMLVGTSLGGCVRSIALGEVLKDDVLVIITRTRCKDVDSIIKVIKEYHRDGNTLATKQTNYDMTGIDCDLLVEIAMDLYHLGKIHQPQLYNGNAGFVHVEMSRNQLWIPLAPSPKTDDQIVVDAYNKYQVLRNLMA